MLILFLYAFRRLLLLIAGYGLVAFDFNLLDETVPIFAATSRQHNGLGLGTNELGVPLSVSGAALMLTAILVFPRMQKWIGLYR
jgi:hypothetical protein